MLRSVAFFSKRWRFWAKVTLTAVVFAAIVVEGALAIHVAESNRNETGPYSPLRAAPTTSAPVPTVLPSPSPATTLIPATAAEQAAFRAGQRWCQTSPATTLVPVTAGEQAAFKAGQEWCQSHPVKRQ